MNVRSVISCRVLLTLVALSVPLLASAQSMEVSPTTLNVQYSPGTSVPSQSILIKKTSNGSTLKWTITNLASWVTVSQTSGGNSGKVVVGFKPSLMPTTTGLYTAFTVTSPTSPAITVKINLTVTGTSTPPTKTLQSLVTNGPTSVSIGQSVQATATATFSDGSTSTMTSGPLYWTTVPSSTAVVTQTGTVIPYGSGSFDLRSEYTWNGVTKYAPVITVTINGTAKTLSGLTITSPSAVNVGQTVQATVVANYSDGSTKSMTSNGPRYWTLETSLANVTQTGSVTGLAAGTMFLRAEYSEGGVTKTAPSVAVSVAGVVSGSVIYVSPSGNDGNSGSSSSPVRTITRAVALANSANLTNDVTISMAAGTYRESVQIFSLNTTKKLTLEGAGSSTVITGADDWTSGWTQQADGSYSHAWTYRWGAKPIPNGWGDYWNWDGKGYLRNRLLRWEMVYVNGAPLTGVLNRSEVSNPGTFYVDENAGLIYMRFPSNVFLGAPVEVATRAIPLAINGRNNVTLRNFAVMRNRGAVQESSVQIANLQNLTLENFTVSWSAYAGLSTSYVTGLKIYNSTFVDNGVNGLNGYRNVNVLLQDAYVARNNWRGWPSEHKGFDTVQKWSETRDMTVLRGNFVDNFGHGLWFDGDNQRIVVDSVFSARNRMRGAYLELNLGPITIKNSKLCENGFEGVANARSNNVTLDFNQIFDNKYWQLTGTGSPTPITITNWQTGQSYQVTGANWTITNNIIRGKNLAGGDPPTNECYPGPCGWAFWAPDDNIYSYIASTLTSDYNQWYHSGTTNSFRVPSSKGSAVNFSTFRSLMSTV
jgi:hypothetical protein